ncbi:hypothetical protein BLTE_14160 [Blastochloris tepida]|uniref:Uncharacterized protein n=1 Tax=Blastochloris tepida TaxID=2233851 RepID=A0A348FZJ8_9HYPH|nr:hypothetical protein BLTE_14160 [Blastochloris tepida]
MPSQPPRHDDKEPPPALAVDASARDAQRVYTARDGAYIADLGAGTYRPFASHHSPFRIAPREIP